MRFVLLLLGAPLLFAHPARAQPAPLTERLYMDSGALVGSSRLTSLGGAYVGLAEGADGLASNYASLAQKSPARQDGWDWDATFSLLQGSAPGARDLDNDGSRDSATSARDLLAGFLLQIGRVGLGVYLRSSNSSFCLADACDREARVDVYRVQSGLALAIAFWRDQLIVGAGFLTSSAQFQVSEENQFYSGGTVEVDALFRPIGQPYRIGFSVKPSAAGALQGNPEPPTLAGRGLYSGTVSPLLLSLGASLRLGRGRERFNRLPNDARQGLTESEAGPAPHPGENPPGPWLLCAQLDAIAPVDNATGLIAFTHPDAARPQVGARWALIPRVGVEHETLLHRLRNRLGFYLEPSIFPEGRARPHLTGGAQVFLAEWLWKWSASASFDVARDYYNFGLSVGFWH